MPTENKTLEYYMGLPYEVVVKHDEDGWFARVPDLPGCMTWADTFEELGVMIEDAKRGYIEDSLEHGDKVPEPRDLEGYSGKVNLRMPKTLHRDLARLAEAEGVSLNQVMVAALARAAGSPVGSAGASGIDPAAISTLSSWLEGAGRALHLDERTTVFLPRPAASREAQEEGVGQVKEDTEEGAGQVSERDDR